VVLRSGGGLRTRGKAYIGKNLNLVATLGVIDDRKEGLVTKETPLVICGDKSSFVGKEIE